MILMLPTVLLLGYVAASNLLTEGEKIAKGDNVWPDSFRTLADYDADSDLKWTPSYDDYKGALTTTSRQSAWYRGWFPRFSMVAQVGMYSNQGLAYNSSLKL